jgi:TorA maturation chaperone TorD
MSLATQQNLALPFLLWSRIWSQLGPDETRAEAWEILGLTSSFEALGNDYWNAFHAGLPAPPASLLFHAALGLDGANVREDWMRAANYLGLEMTGNRLPPDHLAAASEVFAIVLERREPVLARELCERYFLPWCSFATQKLSEVAPALASLPVQFRDDLNLALAEVV